jgi:hypothetical protein
MNPAGKSLSRPMTTIFPCVIRDGCVIEPLFDLATSTGGLIRRRPVLSVDSEVIWATVARVIWTWFPQSTPLAPLLFMCGRRPQIADGRRGGYRWPGHLDNLPGLGFPQVRTNSSPAALAGLFFCAAPSRGTQKGPADARRGKGMGKQRHRVRYTRLDDSSAASDLCHCRNYDGDVT